MRSRLRVNAVRFLALFAAVLPLAFLSPTFALFVLSTPSGLAKDLANVLSATTLINMLSYRYIVWSVTATTFTSIGILLFCRRAQTFWISALVWGASCFLTDVLTTPPANLSALILTVIIIGDINLGGPLGGFYIWIVSSLIERRLASDAKRSSPETIVAAHGRVAISIRSLLTGYAGLNLVAILWVWVAIGTISILITYTAFQNLLTRLWAVGTTLPASVIIGINFVAASVSLIVYLLSIAGIKKSVYVMLRPRSRVAILYLILTAILTALQDRAFLIHQVKSPGTISILSFNLLLFLLMVGFFVNSSLGTVLPTGARRQTW